VNTTASLRPGPLAVPQTDSRTPHQARAYVRTALLGQDIETLDLAELFVSELATNVVRYAPGPCSIEVDQAGAGKISITVMDHSAEPIRITAPVEDSDESGRGLFLMLCSGAELSVSPTATGKAVTATFSPLGVTA
jgi:anti-sigma regulatory factor (Ser/Thr protein kinase)